MKRVLYFTKLMVKWLCMHCHESNYTDLAKGLVCEYCLTEWEAIDIDEPIRVWEDYDKEFWGEPINKEAEHNAKLLDLQLDNYNKCAEELKKANAKIKEQEDMIKLLKNTLMKDRNNAPF